ncbi:Hsp70 family protein [Planosporangium sp. 12N6]|uniref:Hsp70 family protein n=1 Tax=Planosporangium spinosum TaxID=3402278 RepID=UPI003CE7B02C
MGPAGEVRLGIDCGDISTVAVLAWPDGRWQRLLFDGAPRLPGAVYVEADGSLRAGAPAWQHATAVPERFVVAPVRRLREGRIVAGSVAVEAVDLVAALLRRVGEEAARVAGGPVGEVRLVVPAGWGPRRRTLLRQAAHRAGLGQPSLVEAPVAAAQYVLAAGSRMLVGEFVAVCEFGGGCEATVLRRAPDGFEVLATIGDADAGGLRVDELLVDRVAALAAGSLGEPAAAGPLTGGERLALLASVRTARQALARSPSVVVALPPPRPAVVLDAVQVEAVARPVLGRAGRAVRQAVEAAEIDPDRLAGLYCVGAGGGEPLAVRVLAEETGLSPVVVDEPELAATLGAVRAGGPAGAGEAVAEPPLPPVRRAVAMLVPGLASLVLVSHFVLTAHPYNHSGLSFDPADFVVGNWGELAIGAVCALLACLTGATLIASSLRRYDPAPRRSDPSADSGQIGTGLLAAVAFGLSIAGLYAVGASAYFGAPTGPFLRWALLPLVPIAVVVAVTAALVSRWGKTPAAGWHSWLTFPAGSVACAAVGMLGVQMAMTAQVPRWLPLGYGLVGRVGGLLLGIGMTLAVVARPLHRVILAAPLAVFTAAIVSWTAVGLLGLAYVAAATVWWLRRIWHLFRGPGAATAPDRWT